MNIKILLCGLFISFSLCASYLDQENTVMIAAPVVDSAGEPLQQLEPQKSVEEIYNSLPFSPEKPLKSCPRIHQFLFNEVGKVVKQDGAETYVEFPHLFYENDQREKQHRFWVLTKNIISLAPLKQKLGNLAALPEPLNFLKPRAPEQYEQILTLIMPWQDSTTGIVYSAGTRFKRVPERDTSAAYGISLINTQDGSVKQLLIEKDAALVDYPSDHKSAKKLFVEILKKWASVGPKKIAYVWGGCGFVETYTQDDFSKVAFKRGAEDQEAWQRPNGQRPAPTSTHAGFDCSGLVLRAAQIAGLPYFCKNTTTLCRNLKDIADNEPLEEGDLIWIPGHVMVITNLAKNEYTDAVGYSSGYGILHTMCLKDAFEGIVTFDDLRRACKDKQPLNMKNIRGVSSRTFKECRLLKM
jgi:hypothetical protein